MQLRSLMRWSWIGWGGNREHVIFLHRKEREGRRRLRRSRCGKPIGIANCKWFKLEWIPLSVCAKRLRVYAFFAVKKINHLTASSRNTQSSFSHPPLCLHKTGLCPRYGNCDVGIESSTEISDAWHKETRSQSRHRWCADKCG